MGDFKETCFCFTSCCTENKIYENQCSETSGETRQTFGMLWKMRNVLYSELQSAKEYMGNTRYTLLSTIWIETLTSYRKQTYWYKLAKRQRDSTHPKSEDIAGKERAAIYFQKTGSVRKQSHAEDHYRLKILVVTFDSVISTDTANLIVSRNV